MCLYTFVWFEFCLVEVVDVLFINVLDHIGVSHKCRRFQPVFWQLISSFWHCLRHVLWPPPTHVIVCCHWGTRLPTSIAAGPTSARLSCGAHRFNRLQVAHSVTSSVSPPPPHRWRNTRHHWTAHRVYKQSTVTLRTVIRITVGGSPSRWTYRDVDDNAAESCNWNDEPFLCPRFSTFRSAPPALSVSCSTDSGCAVRRPTFSLSTTFQGDTRIGTQSTDGPISTMPASQRRKSRRPVLASTALTQLPKAMSSGTITANRTVSSSHTNHSDLLSCYVVNARSLKEVNALQLLETEMSSCMCDVAAVTETWLSKTVDSNFILYTVQERLGPPKRRWYCIICKGAI